MPPQFQTQFCRVCRGSVQVGAGACPSCGYPPLSGTNYCFRCGNPTNPMIDPCPNCQSRLVNMAGPAAAPHPAPHTSVNVTQVAYAPPVPVAVYPPPKSKGVAALLCFFLSFFGAHRFYSGQTGVGVALLLQTLILIPITLGLWSFVVFVWVVIDFILILAGGVRDQYGQPLR